jgi:hypothetical protein
MPFSYNWAPNAYFFNTNTNNYINTNLFLNLDAGNSSSYSGTGTNWIDLSNNSRNATLINNPTFNSSQNGYFHFTDTSFQYAVTPIVPSLTNWTVEAWYRPTKSLTGKVTAVITNEFNLTTSINYSFGNNNAPFSYTLAGGFYNSAWRTTSGFTPNLNNWYQGAVTYNGSVITQYNNATSQSTLSYVGTPQSGGTVRIARRWDESGSIAANFFDGDISIIRIYNIALSPSQILQNYNAIKGRYGL